MGEWISGTGGWVRGLGGWVGGWVGDVPTGPSRRRRPLILPTVLRSARMSRRQVFPLPEGPITASI